MRRSWLTGVSCLTLVLVTSIATAQQSGRRASDSSDRRRIAVVTAEQVLDGDGAVCDATLVPGLRGQLPTVIASVDYSGRRFCNTIVRVLAGTPPSVLQRLPAFNVEDVSSIVRDIDGDTYPELVIPHAWSDYEGANSCQAAMLVVYECSDDTCTDASTRFGSFYSDRLQELDERLQLNENVASIESAHRSERPCLLMERDKIVRMVGTDPHAGLSLAEQWAGSSDQYLRKKAVAVFADIADEAGQKGLEKLSKDADRGVADLARTALQRIRSFKVVLSPL